MKKTVLIIISLVLLSASQVFCQETDVAATAPAETTEDKAVTAEENHAAETEEETVEGETKKKKSIFDNFEFIVQFEPTLYLSPDSLKNKSNLINIIYPIAMGFSWPKDFWIGFQPTINFFTMPLLWFDNMALPAEIENRTASALSTFLNLPAVFTIKLPHSKMHITSGIGIFLRYGFLSIGVDQADPGYNGNTAKEDVRLINKWFWQNGHWFYATLGTSWLYPISEQFQIGPVINAYIPMGTLIDQHDVQGMMISIGIKLCI